MELAEFRYVAARTLDQAAKGSRSAKAAVVAGGTDLLGVLKDRVHPEYPETLVDLKTIPGLAYVKEGKKALRIGSLTTLSAIANHPRILKIIPRSGGGRRAPWGHPRFATWERSAAISARSHAAGITARRRTSFIASGKGVRSAEPCWGTTAITPFLAACGLPPRRARQRARARLTSPLTSARCGKETWAKRQESFWKIIPCPRSPESCARITANPSAIEASLTKPYRFAVFSVTWESMSSNMLLS